MKARSWTWIGIILLAIAGLAACTSAPREVETYPADDARHVDVNGVEVHYFDFSPDGDETPIVWVHGYSAGAFEVTYIEDDLGPDRRIIALDLPGHGYSEKPEIEYTLDYYTGFLADFIDELGLDRYILVGHSMGGLIVSTFAAGQPPGLERLILVSPYVFGGEAGPIAEFLADTGILVDYGLELHNESVIEIAMRASVFHNPERIPQDLIDYLTMSTFHTPNAIPALASVTRNIIAGEHDPSVLDRVDVPTLVIWGAEDRVLDYRYSAQFNRRIADSTLEAIPNCGHLPHVEFPEVTARIIDDWLAGTAER